jgi:hypothetical protein
VCVCNSHYTFKYNSKPKEVRIWRSKADYLKRYEIEIKIQVWFVKKRHAGMHQTFERFGQNCLSILHLWDSFLSNSYTFKQVMYIFCSTKMQREILQNLAVREDIRALLTSKKLITLCSIYRI